MSAIKKNVNITRHVKKNFSSPFGAKGEVEIILANLPAEVNVNQNNEWISTPVVFQEKHIMEYLVDPLSKALAKIYDNLKTNRPHCLIDFDYKSNIAIKQTDVSIEKTSEVETAGMANDFIAEESNRSFDDIILPAIVRMRIETALNRILYHEKLYNEWNLKKIDPHGRRTAINFFGPPGTGKTFCAEAIANYLNKKIIRVNYAEIESKYVGETPKRITSAFRKAKETDAILFFDEADSILGKRLTNVTQSADHGVNVSRSVMLLQLDAFDGIVIFASNLPSNYDSAFVRRILAHIEFELPDKECLMKLWMYLLPKEVPRSDDISPEWLASQSESLSGGDILNVVKLSASQAVVRVDDKCKILQSDILDSITQVKVGKEKVGLSV